MRVRRRRRGTRAGARGHAGGAPMRERLAAAATCGVGVLLFICSWSWSSSTTACDAQLSDRAEPGQPAAAGHREGHRRAGHGLRHHQRRDRPLGGIGDGPLGGRRGAIVRVRACRWRSASWSRWLVGRPVRPVQRLLGRRGRTAVAGGHARGLSAFAGWPTMLIEDRSIGRLSRLVRRPGPDVRSSGRSPSRIMLYRRAHGWSLPPSAPLQRASGG